VRDGLEQVRIPDADAAGDRARDVVLAVFQAREPVPRPSRGRRIGIGVAVAGAAVALAVASPPGMAVVDRVREAVGVERVAPALFSLPAPGRLLVASDAGIWVVDADGKKRLLAGYREASWSPFGRFIVATRANELAALTPDGDVHWTLARPDVRDARWGGTRVDTRIAYADRTGIRVVAGDGTGDRLFAPRASGPVAWRPGVSFQLAYVDRRVVNVRSATDGSTVWKARLDFPGPVAALEWSPNGRLLLVLSQHHLRVYDLRGRLVQAEDPSEGWPDVAAEFRPGSQEVGVARVHGSQSSVYVLDGRQLFNGMGEVSGLAWSPDGRWLVVGWRSADQWLFVRWDGRRIHAVSNVSAQFRSRTFPRLGGWCCPGRGS
jgi:hypothetical protein